MIVLTAIFLVILGTLPSFAWLVFFTSEDCHPEPRRLIFFTFLSGVIITFFTLQAQIFTNKWLLGFGIGNFSITSLIILTAIEEIAKFLAVFFIVHKQKEFDEPIDAMIYMIVAALGFAAVENIALVFRTVNDPAIASGAINIITLRFIGATLLHALSSAIIGYYWAKAIFKQVSATLPIIWGLVIATVLHAVFNYIIINVDSVVWPVVFLIIMAAFIFRDFEVFRHSKE